MKTNKEYRFTDHILNREVIGDLMKYLEHRRHSIRDKPNGSYLNQQGVDLARKVGDGMLNENKEFDIVITSTLHRAIQTPIAMGWAVNMVTDQFLEFDEQMNKLFQHLNISWNNNDLQLIYNTIEKKPLHENYAEKQINLYKSFLNRIDENQSILIISHGGVIDIPLIKMIQDYKLDAGDWTTTFGYCEGYGINYDGNIFTDLQIYQF